MDPTRVTARFATPPIHFSNLHGSFGAPAQRTFRRARSTIFRTSQEVALGLMDPTRVTARFATPPIHFSNLHGSFGAPAQRLYPAIRDRRVVIVAEGLIA